MAALWAWTDPLGTAAAGIGDAASGGAALRGFRPRRRSLASAAATAGGSGFCHACFSGEYAVPFTPATGRRFLTRAGHEGTGRAALLQGALTLADLRIPPTPLEVVVPEYLKAYTLPSARLPVV